MTRELLPRAPEPGELCTTAAIKRSNEIGTRKVRFRFGRRANPRRGCNDRTTRRATKGSRCRPLDRPTENATQPIRACAAV